MFNLFKKAQDHQADVKSAGTALTVKAGDNLLKSALEAGLAWPHDCRVGSCGTCRCRLLDGKIKPLSDFSYVLDGEQINGGMILACQTSLRSDIVVDVKLDSATEKTVGVSTVQGRISSARNLTHDILEVIVKLEKALPRAADSRSAAAPYLAGQYAELAVPGIDQPRSYSFARAPENEADECMFYVRLVPGGEMTTWLFAEDRVGTSVTVGGPYGSFWLREGDSPIVCIAGGSGMSSIKALLEHACNNECPRDVVYLFGARAQKDLYCLDEMGQLRRNWNANGDFRFIPILSEEPQDSDWEGPRGFVTEHIESQGIDLASSQGYLCGPPPMIDAAIEVLERNGMSNSNIFFDKFLDASTMPGGRN